MTFRHDYYGPGSVVLAMATAVALLIGPADALLAQPAGDAPPAAPSEVKPDDSAAPVSQEPASEGQETPVSEPAAEAEPPAAEAAEPERGATTSEPVEPSEGAAAEPAAPLPPKPAEADVLDAVAPAASSEPAAPVEEPQAAAQEGDPAEKSPEAADGISAPGPGDDPMGSDAADELDLPPDVASAMDDFMREEVPKELRFNFHYQPWEDVIQWFADQADLSLMMKSSPKGTFNYTDRRLYTPAEAIDLLNGVLLTEGYTLLRRDRMLMVINLEDEIPWDYVSTIPEEELDERGEFELVGVLFQLDKFDPEEAKTEIEQLIGPQGSVVVLPKTKQLRVIETAGRLRTIRRVIRRVEDPDGLLSGNLESYEFEHILPDEGLMVLRQLMNIPLDANGAEDDTFRFALDPFGMRVLFSGSPDKIAKARKILEAVDVSQGDGTESSAALETLQLKVYPIAIADAEAVLKVMQTLLEGSPGVRLSIDPQTKSLIALARPTEHATIRATIDQMQMDVRRIEVIALSRIDPQIAAVSIKKMFGEPSEENTTAPTVEPDTVNRQLVVHGTDNQIEQIRVLLGKMGETEFAGGPVPSGSRIRMIPISGHSAEVALQNLRMIWPTISNNPIKEVNPSAIMPSVRSQPEAIPAVVPARSHEEETGQRRRPYRRPEGMAPPGGFPELSRPQRDVAPPAESDRQQTGDRQTAIPAKVRFQFAAQTQESVAPAGAEPPEAEESLETEEATEGAEAVPEESPSDEPRQPEAVESVEAEPTPAESETVVEPERPSARPPIVISRGPNGLMIASEDTAALDEFERLLTSMSGGANPDQTELRVFYLKYAKAAVVSETLTKIIGSGTTGATTAAEDGLLGDLVGGALGGTVGALMNLGATTLSPTGMLRITPETRLNALIVEANSTDLRNIEEVLKLLDQPESPEEILVNPKPRLIPIVNMAAEEVAEIVKEIFAENLQQASSNRGGGGGNRPSPADFFAAMRGGRGGGPQRGGGNSGGTNNSAAQQEPEHMTVGVDETSNSLIVFASESLYEDVRALVEELDMVAGTFFEDQESTVIKLGPVSPDAMRAALSAVLGDDAVVSSSSSSSSSSRRTTTSRTGQSRTTSGRGGADAEAMRRRFEIMRAMQGRGGPGGFGGGRGGGR